MPTHPRERLEKRWEGKAVREKGRGKERRRKIKMDAEMGARKRWKAGSEKERKREGKRRKR